MSDYQFLIQKLSVSTSRIEALSNQVDSLNRRFIFLYFLAFANAIAILMI